MTEKDILNILRFYFKKLHNSKISGIFSLCRCISRPKVNEIINRLKQIIKLLFSRVIVISFYSSHHQEGRVLCIDSNTSQPLSLSLSLYHIIHISILQQQCTTVMLQFYDILVLYILYPMMSFSLFYAFQLTFLMEISKFIIY